MEANLDEILKEMKDGNINHSKNLITSKEININTKNPENGMTLLMYAVVNGNYDLVDDNTKYTPYRI